MTDRLFFLDEHGCAKNQVDGELLIDRMKNLGFKRTLEAEEAEIIIINTCGFIESAKKESLAALMNARKAYPDAKIILCGCLAERYAEIFSEQLPEADAIFGNGDLSKLDEVVKKLFKGKRPVVVPEQKGVCCGKRSEFLSFKGSAFVKITEGCNNDCSFCAIPVIRGNLRSRKADDIIEEIKLLVENGIYEINLIGQDLAAYGCGKEDDVFGNHANWYEKVYGNSQDVSLDSNDYYNYDDYCDSGISDNSQSISKASVNEKQSGSLSFKSISEEYSELNEKKSPLSRLMKKISELNGNFTVRLLYIHPDHFNSDILPVMQTDKRFLPYFDIPFQSGSTKIINAMNRKGTSEKYVELVETIRKSLPEAAIRTTFLTGFPGETEEDAEETRQFLEKIESDWSGCFEYSREEDTTAYEMKKRVPKKTARERAELLNEIQHKITERKLKTRTGKIYDVLVEEIIENQTGTAEGLAIGRTWFEAPEVDGNIVIRYDLDDEKAVNAIHEGCVVKVKAAAASELDIDGVFCGS